MQFQLKLLLAGIAIACHLAPVHAQVKIGNNPTTINTNSLLELETTTKGLLMPRVALISTTSASPLSAHVAGMTVFNTATAGSGSTAVSPGYYYNDGTQWYKLLSSSNVVVNANYAGATVSNNNTLTLVPSTGSLNVNVGDVIEIKANLMVYATGGSNGGGDYIVISPITTGTAVVTWSSGTAVLKTVTTYAPFSNRNGSPSGYPSVSPTDYIEYGTVTTAGTLAASLQGVLTTDDTWSYNNAVLIIRKN